MSKEPQKERTLVILKPDVIQRQIVGEILTRFERKGFKIIGMKMVWPTEELMREHYIDEDEYHRSVGIKAVDNAKEKGEDVTGMDPVEIGRRIRNYNVEYLSCGPVLAFVLEGNSVIEGVRKLLGKTNPRLADVGTIRADYTPDSYFLADMQGRATRTIAHASDSVESAEREIPLWFKDDELYEYSTAIEHILYDAGWSKEK
jgi:nucleoside-diphosphate kinase